MKLAASNRSWTKEYDELMYRFLSQQRMGIEISPSRTLKIGIQVQGEGPAREEIIDWSGFMRSYFGIEIVSMQSVLPKTQENIFSSSVSRRFLVSHMGDIFAMAGKMGCGSVSFRCPENRIIPEGTERIDSGKIAVDFFAQAAAKAAAEKVVLSVEAVPKSEGTNFLNYTDEAIGFVKCIDSPYLKAGIDMGTVIANNEKIEDIITPENIPYINHVRVSEPDLGPIQRRNIHMKTAELLKKYGYNGYVSTEMNEYPDIRQIMGLLAYIRLVFGE